MGDIGDVREVGVGDISDDVREGGAVTLGM